MKHAKFLLATVAFGAIAGAAVPAQARTSAASARTQEIQMLRAQIEALTARLDSYDAAQRQAQAQAQNAQAQAAQEQAAAVTAQVKSEVQTQVKAATAGTEKSTKEVLKAVEWAKDTKISGRVYFNASSITNKDAAGAKVTSNNGEGYQIKRFYLGVDHKFDNVFSGNVTTDVSNIGGVGQALYVKKAYLQARISPAFVVRLGATDLPWVPYSEGIYGYRHLENVLIDRTKFGTSSDWGIHVSGDLAGGLVSYAVAALDGGGYRNPQLTKTIDLEGRLSLNYKGVQAAIGGYTGKLGRDVNGAAPTMTSDRFNALLAYKTKMFTVGGEYFTTSNWKGFADDAEGYSVFASVTPVDKWSVFGRYDWVKPNKITAPTVQDNYFNIGVQYSPAKIVDLALVYKRDKADNGPTSTSNGTIGGVGGGTYDEIGLFGQFRF